MANEIRITVCVVALTQGDYADLDPKIQAKLAALRPSFDFAISGKPYATSPDEWQPFNVALPIREYLKNANLTATFLSSQLYDNATALDVLKKTQLYIIDPLVLTHSKKRDWLTRDIQRTIYTADVEKAFCIILPADLPPSLRDEIATMYSTDLNNLYGI